MTLHARGDDFAETLARPFARTDLPDGRTRLHCLEISPPGDIHEVNRYARYRVLDRAARRPIVDFWKLDVDMDANWNDETLTFTISPGSKTLRIDIARNRYDWGDAAWRPLGGIQEDVEATFGDGFGHEARARAAYWPGKHQPLPRQPLRERILDALILLVFFGSSIASFLAWTGLISLPY